jgi:hypothetical protein
MFLRSHPGMVCLCGRAIQNNTNVLLDHSSRALSFHNWEHFPVEQLYSDIYAYNTFRSIVNSLHDPQANNAAHLLRNHFAGSLDDVFLNTVEEETLADFLTSQGVLLKPDVSQRKYNMASALVNGLIRTRFIPSKFPNAPSTLPPFYRDVGPPCVLDVLIESLKFFNKDLIRFASYRSYEPADVTVDCASISEACWIPREGVYVTELMRILSNWLGKYG